MKFRYIFVVILILSPIGCNSITVDSVSGERIEVGPGPEDMVLDTLHSPRLLISCAARREAYKPYGEIEALDLISMERTVLARFNEPDSLVFRPHGIYLDGDMLFVISHEREPDTHPVLVYRVHEKHLEFKEMILTNKQHSPNALVTGPKGDIYLVNDSGKRGSMIEKALKLKRASVVRLKKNTEDQWDSQFMATDLGYPAGINRLGNEIFIGDATLNLIHHYRISEKGLATHPDIEGLKGNDNIRTYQGKVLTCGHVKPLRFVRHAKNQDKLSPVEVFLVDPTNGKSETIFANDGSQISGASTAIIFHGYIYICQVFEPYILKVKTDI
jgi:hypothetical protein